MKVYAEIKTTGITWLLLGAPWVLHRPPWLVPVPHVVGGKRGRMTAESEAA